MELTAVGGCGRKPSAEVPTNTGSEIKKDTNFEFLSSGVESGAGEILFSELPIEKEISAHGPQ